MNISISAHAKELGEQAGTLAKELIQQAISRKGSANIILATGASQFEMIRVLVASDIDWSKVSMFHLDEYIGLPVTHKASFRKYLTERFINQLPVPLKAAYLINGETHPKEECERLNTIILEHPVDVALVGIGENGHLAFNDPPADFDTDEPYIVVRLDEPCRRQQLNEGWFPALEDVPQQAISMSIKQIMKSAAIICSVPDERKATAVKNSIEQTISNQFPASILQAHPNCYFFLDQASASLLNSK